MALRMKVASQDTCRPYVESPPEDKFSLTDGMLCAGGVEAEAVCSVMTITKIINIFWSFSDLFFDLRRLLQA